MEKQEIKNISDFFSKDSTELTPEDKWSAIFHDWINKIDQKQKLLNLFETKLWFESIEDFFSSAYLEKIIFKFQDSNLRNYDFYLTTYAKILSKIITQLKELDFKKDNYFAIID